MIYGRDVYPSSIEFTQHSNLSLGATMSVIANTPTPPYFAVIFTSTRTPGDNGYSEMAEKMVTLAAQQPGFLGIESAREDVGITVSYWADLDAIKQWKANTEHLTAQKMGHQSWYDGFKVRIAKVERDYGI
jgi:heme-degrading monooxygenase HmoA